MLSRDQILGAADLPAQDVEVPEWGGSVKVRGLSAADLEAFDASTTKPGPDGKPVADVSNFRAKLLVRCLVGEDGTALFTEADIAALAAKSAAAIQRCYTVASRLSGLTVSVEDLKGN